MATPMSACSFFIVLSFLVVELAPAEERVGVEAKEHLDHVCLSLPVRGARHHVIEAVGTRARDHVTTAAALRRTRRRCDGDGEDDRRSHDRGWYCRFPQDATTPSRHLDLLRVRRWIPPGAEPGGGPARSTPRRRPRLLRQPSEQDRTATLRGRSQPSACRGLEQRP